MKLEKGNEPDFGALVISLDFELHWGMRDLYHSNDPSTTKLFFGARKVIPRILELFEENGIAATWATVGYLFAESKEEVKHFSPQLIPAYKDTSLNPYNEVIGENEKDDPLHFAPQLIELIGEKKRQEIATHTFSHYYCLEEGQSKETFAVDLDSAIAIASKNGFPIRSIVFPRNQHNPEYDEILKSKGIVCYRGNESSKAYQSVSRNEYNTPFKRAFRLLDTFINLSGHNLVTWDNLLEKSGLCNVASSRFLRPYVKDLSILDRFRLKRISKAMHNAARTKKIIHLWWHPHNFAEFPEENLRGLSYLLNEFKICQKKYGMQSLNMAEAAEIALKFSNESRTLNTNTLSHVSVQSSLEKELPITAFEVSHMG